MPFCERKLVLNIQFEPLLKKISEAVSPHIPVAGGKTVLLFAYSSASRHESVFECSCHNAHVVLEVLAKQMMKDIVRNKNAYAPESGLGRFLLGPPSTIFLAAF